MKPVVYIGPHTAVVVPHNGGEIEAERGKPVEVPDELAASLLEQDTWADPAAPPERKRKVR